MMIAVSFFLAALIAPAAHTAVTAPVAYHADGPPSYETLVHSRPGMLAHWRLGEGGPTSACHSLEACGYVAGDDPHDLSSSDPPIDPPHNGLYAGAVLLGQPGALTADPDTSAYFTRFSNGGVVSIPPFAPVVDFTVEGWTNLDDAPGVTNETLYGGTGSARILVRNPPTTTSTAYASVWLNGTDYALQPAQLNGESNNKVWVHWALTRQANVLTLYRNGLQIAQRTDLPPTATANLDGYIGIQKTDDAMVHGWGLYPLTGRIDEVALYSQALSGRDVADDYLTGMEGASYYRDVVRSESSLLSYLRLVETAGTKARDETRKFNGTYSNVTGGAPGALNNDASTLSSTFNGSTSKVTLPSLGQVSDFTIEGWTNLAGSSTTNNTLYGALGAVRLLVRPGMPSSPTTAYAGVWLDGTEYVLQPKSTESNVNAWVYWVLTRHANTLTLYRNGVQVGQRTDLPPTATATLSGALGAQGGNAYFLNGRIEEVATYTTALDQTQIDNHYIAAVHGRPLPWE